MGFTPSVLDGEIDPRRLAGAMLTAFETRRNPSGRIAVHGAAGGPEMGDASSSINEIHKRTKCPVIINTSFNVRGEPIVCTPEDAYRCFMRTEMDYLVMGSFLLDKHEQPKEEHKVKKYFELD